MPTTVIPCRRPKVAITAHPRTFDHTDTVATYHLAECHVPGCGWEYDAAVVTDAQQQATWHRQEHRAAVPAAGVVKLPAGPNYEHRGYQASCDADGWTFNGTAGDCQVQLDAHLHSEHGLVTC